MCLETKLSSVLLWARAGEAPPAPSKLPTWQPSSTCSPNSHPHPVHCPDPPADRPTAIQKGCGLRSHFTSSFLLVGTSCCSLINAICNAGAASSSSDQFFAPPRGDLQHLPLAEIQRCLWARVLRDAPAGTGCRLQCWCRASSRQSGKAGRRGGARSMGRRPNHTKAQGSLGKRAADKAQLPGRVVDPWAGTGRCSPSLPKANSRQPQLVFPPCPLNNCPSVWVPRSGGAGSSEGTKARRGFVRYTLPSISSTHQPRWDERSLSVPRPGARGGGEAGEGRLQLCGSSPLHF